MVLAISGRGAVLQVPGDYATIQQAIDAARPGDEIRVAAGVYLENLTIAKQGIHLLGAGDEATIIDGNGARETVLISDADAVRIEGFTLRNGSVLVHGRRSAGIVLTRNKFFSAQFYGVWFEQSPQGAVQRVADNHFVDNTWGLYSLADWRYGDVHYEITGNLFTGNRYGIWLDSTARFLVERNSIFLSSGMAIMVNWNNLGSRIQRNVIVTCGEAIHVVEQDDEYPDRRRAEGRGQRADDSGLMIYHNTLDGNFTGLSLRVVEGFAYDIANNIIYNSINKGVWSHGPMASVQFRYNDVFSTFRGANYAGDMEDRTGRDGNISIEPEFEDAREGNYHLQSTSPCIDAGVDVGLPFFGKAPDLGAFEYLSPRIHTNLHE
jgi:parallel beta-helix repeat protein